VESYETLYATSRTQEAMCALDKDGKIIGATQMLGNDLDNPCRANLAWPSTIGTCAEQLIFFFCRRLSLIYVCHY
jgi:hypothetical protein